MEQTSTVSGPVVEESVGTACGELAAVAANAADSKKATDTVVLQVGPVLGITDEFVITSGSNPRQVKTIVDFVEEKIKEAGGGSPRGVEGLDDSRWVLMDYGDFVVHVFLQEAREFYNIERLWGDAMRMDWIS